MHKDLTPPSPSLPPAPTPQPELFHLPEVELEPASPPPGPGPQPEAGVPATSSPRGPQLEGELRVPPHTLEEWKLCLRRDFELWLASLDQIPDAPEPQHAEPPDLYSFYEQLAASNAETRKANRRTVEAFAQWGDTLSQFDTDLRQLREQLARLPTAREDTLPRPWCLALAEILDRAQRLRAAFDSPPRTSWLGRDTRWRRSWETQRQGFDILAGHLEQLLQAAGVVPLTTLHQPFDPTTMSAVRTVPGQHLPHHTVLEQLTPGYRWNGELLRVAQVVISTRAPDGAGTQAHEPFILSTPKS